MKTIGVLGGIGPQATFDFEARVHRTAPQHIPRRMNAGYPGMVVWYCRHPPLVLNDDGSPRLPPEPDPRFLDAAARIGPLCDFMVIVSNGAHVFRPQVERASGRPVLSMIDATVAELRRRGWRRVGALGLGGPRAYLAPLREAGIAVELVDDEAQRALDDAAFAVMEGRADDATPRAAARAAIDTLRGRGVDGIILGCTEFPLLLPDADDAPDMINPTQVLADAAVRHAMT